MSSFFDRMKGKLEAAGKGAQKLTRMGQLKMDLMSAEKKLTDCHRSLGKACAVRFMERNETVIEADDAAIAQYLRDLRSAQREIEQIKEEMDETRTS